MTRQAIAPSDAIAVNAVLVAVRQGADVVCDRWFLSLIFAAFLSASRFAEFMRSTGAASRLATMRLTALVEHGILVRLPYNMRPLRHEYRLTNMGQAMFDIMVQMVRWEATWNPDFDPKPFTRAHPELGELRAAGLRCRACGAPVTARDIRPRVSQAQMQKMPPKLTVHRRSTLNSAASAAIPGLPGDSLDVFGDKWGIEILVCAFTGIKRFNDFRACTAISANILSDRLVRLTTSGLLRPVTAAGEQGYRLTAKGLDAYGVLVALQDWADDWLSHRYRSPLRLIHVACGHTLHPIRLGGTVRKRFFLKKEAKTFAP